MNEIEINDQIIAEQLKAFKENKPVKEVGIILVHINHGDRREKDNYKLDGEKYFIAYENEPTVPITALKPDLIEFREDYGLDIDTTNGSVSPITHESLNSGRFIELARFKGAIELGVDYYEMYNLEKDGTWGTYTVFDRKGNEVQKERIPKKLKADVKKDIKINIAKGLYVLCMFVGEETEKPDQIIEIMRDRFNNDIYQAVIDCGNKGDIQIIFDGEDFHTELITDKSFIRGYVIMRKEVLRNRSWIKVANKHIEKSLEYFLKKESLEIILV